MSRNEATNEGADYREHNRQLKDAIDWAAIGYHMKEVRRSRKLTQAEVAELMHWGTKYYASVESGKRQISLPKLIQFTCIMKASSDRLLSGCHEDYPQFGADDSSDLRRRVNKLLDKCSEEEMLLIEVVAESVLAKRK